jgi:hypothetical protein|nr:MAG TPA_asm: hypothetical protein [Caudoviricetes sp.]
MIQYLLKTTEEIMVDTEVDVDSLQDFLKRDAEEQNYVIKTFSYEKKVRKMKGEEDEEYYKCKVVKLFNSEKYPDLPLRKVVYTGFNDGRSDEI